jgi:Carboxypeptidase regulatory-like domain
MRRLVVVTVIALGACASQAAAPSGGVEGTVTAGPTCPVEIQGSPCPPQIWTGTVRATGADGSVHDTETDAAGRYRLSLAPGTYDVAAVVAGPGPPSARPVSVTVGESIQTLDLQVDTGIR